MGLKPMRRENVPLHATDAPASDEDDATLLARVRLGNDAAFDALFYRYAIPLATFVDGLIHAPDEAADLVQDVLVRLWERRQQLAPDTNLRAYLFAAARNAALNVMRHRRTRDRYAYAWHADVAFSEVALVEATSEISGREPPSLLALERAIAQLPERCRQVFVLRWQHEMSYAEIATVLGVTPKTVENQITKALALLRQAVSR